MFFTIGSTTSVLLGAKVRDLTSIDWSKKEKKIKEERGKKKEGRGEEGKGRHVTVTYCRAV